MAFHNPYNFIPAPAREHLPEGLGDRAPAGHHRWHESLWSGDIGITIRTVTPLLLTREREDADRRDGEHPKHRHLDVATSVDPDGATRVDLAPTQLKGMLRGAYEAVTCSRFGVFEQQDRLGHRSDVSSAARLRPALVTASDKIVLLGELYGVDGRQFPSVTVAAWDVVGTGRSWRLADLAHGDQVEAVIVLDVFENRGRTVRRWRAEAVRRAGERWTRSAEPSKKDRYLVRGWLHATGPTIKGKGSERIFVTEVLDGKNKLLQEQPRLVKGAAATNLVNKLVELTAHQRQLHQSAGDDEIWTREKDGRTRRPWEYLGDDPGSTAWARHLYETATTADAPPWIGKDWAIPRDPTDEPLTCWAESTGTRLRPVMVSRLLNEHHQGELLDGSVHPATSLAELSPADRVFGWVSQSATPDRVGAHRGQLRVVEVRAPLAVDAVEGFTPLTIEPLSSPKPSQGRFYVGQRGPDGLPQRLACDVTKDKLFQQDHMLRGRKVYPHQERLVGKTTDELRGLLAYEPPPGRPERDSQNATLHQWVKPDVQFNAVLRVDNLNDLELGALLWLLDPARLGRSGEPGRFKLGSGKPLGFGSVEVVIDMTRTRLSTGIQVAERFRTLRTTTKTADWSMLAVRFDQAMVPRFAPVLDAVRQAASGISAAAETHYPRPHRQAPGYTWFVDNEKEVRNNKAQALPLLGGGLLRERP